MITGTKEPETRKTKNIKIRIWNKRKQEEN